MSPWDFYLFFHSSADPSGFSITSPDHPPAWYNGTGDKLNQYLAWSDTKGQLVAHVAYNLGNSTSYQRDQTWVDNFELSFPTVHLDRSTNRLYVPDHGREITIGRLESGVFGTRVVLSDNFELSAHRRHGVVQAAIKPVSRTDR